MIRAGARAPRSQSPGRSSDYSSRAERNIAWIERHLRVPEGQYVGNPLKLAPYMMEDIRAIYDNPHGTRLAIISRGRKNAKTTESAMLLLLHLCGPEAQTNGQLFSTAQSRDQAAVLFRLASKMVRMSPTLSHFVTIKDTAKVLECPSLGTMYRALSAEAATAYGLSPTFTVHDELGQVKGPVSDLYDALETATAAQANPLSIVISTQAPTDGDLLSRLIDDAATGANPKTVLRFDSAPEHLDPFSEDAIRAANPAFDFFMNKAVVFDMAETAKRMPADQPSFENLVLNRRVEMNSRFISRILWNECGDDVADTFDGYEIFAGLDLSETSDLTAFVQIAKIEGVWNVKPIFWLPATGLAEKSRQDRVPYDLWARQGFLETTPGRSIEYEHVAARIFDIHCQSPFRKIAFDRWNFKHLKPWLQRAGFHDHEIEGDNAIFEMFGQGFQSMSPALRTLESLFLNRQIAHGNHPVLSMCAANATIEANPAGGRKLSKSKSHGRIDGMVSLAMAAAVAGAHVESAAVKYMTSEDIIARGDVL